MDIPYGQLEIYAQYDLSFDAFVVAFVIKDQGGRITHRAKPIEFVPVNPGDKYEGPMMVLPRSEHAKRLRDLLSQLLGTSEGSEWKGLAEARAEHIKDLRLVMTKTLTGV